MDFEIEAFLPDKNDIIKEYGLEGNGRVQRVVDSEFMRYMKLNMPKENGGLISSVVSPVVGLVEVRSPYAHYQNEGILYVDPKYDKGAFYSEDYGFWSRPNVAKVPSGRTLKNYYEASGGPGRGAHFVERTVTNNLDDILTAALKEMNRK